MTPTSPLHPITSMRVMAAARPFPLSCSPWGLRDKPKGLVWNDKILEASRHC